MNFIMKCLTKLIIALLLLFIIPVPGSAATLRVPGDYAQIQPAINAAVDGDTILVSDGTYIENIDFLGKAITLKSENGAANTIIDGNQNGSVVTFASGEDSNSVLEGFTITNGNGTRVWWFITRGGGIYCVNSSPRITNSIISNNTAWGGGGIYFYISSPIVNNCPVNNNSAVRGGGFFVQESLPEITHSTISSNTAWEGGGIYAVDSSWLTVSNSILWGDQASSAGDEIYLDATSAVDITYSDIAGGWAGAGNINADPLFTTDGTYHLSTLSPCIDTATDVGAAPNDIDGDLRPQGAGYDMGADEWICVISVPDDYVTIQGAINAAYDSCEIVVDAGTYNENINFGGKAVTVRSAAGMAGTTINGNQNGSVATFVNGEGSDSVLEGFTITNGNGTPNQWGSTDGGGIYCIAASPTIIDCAINSNSAGIFGGGIYCESSSPTITNCIINNNVAGYGYGGGVFCWNFSSPTITHSTISGNYANSEGGGVFAWDSSSPVIENCNISNNTANASGGGVFGDTASLRITNCTITGNSADWGGGLFFFDSVATITNCTVTENTASFYGGGLYGFYYSSLGMVNGILWENTAGLGDSEIYIDVADSSIGVTYSDIMGGWTGNGNIAADPLFVDPGNNNYHLAAGSACIDAGDPASGPPDFPITDIDGDSRPQAAGYDMGADEYVSALLIAPSRFSVKALSGRRTITLRWQDNSAGEDGFVIGRKRGSCKSGNPWQEIVGVPANTTSYFNRRLRPNTKYSYRVRAYKAYGNSRYSNCRTARTQP